MRLSQHGFARAAWSAILATLLFWNSVAPARLLAQTMEEESRDSAEAADTHDEPLERVADGAKERAIARAVEAAREAEQASSSSSDKSSAATRIPVDVARKAVIAGLAHSSPIQTFALPTGDNRSGVGSQVISLPAAEGSIGGMGESFAPNLSAGTITLSLPFALAPGRAQLQPSLGLSYSSSAGNSEVGFGWSLGTTAIMRQTSGTGGPGRHGLPHYDDRAAWHAEEDRFFFSGGQELVPVDSAAAAQVDASNGLYPAASDLPAEVRGFQQYRAQIESHFYRFFRAPDGRRWIVQAPDGARFEFGVLLNGDAPSQMVQFSEQALEREETGTAIYSWALTRMSDSHGSSIYYRYQRDQGRTYLRDIYYVSPASCAAGTPEATRSCAAPLEDYGARVHLDYEARPDAFTSYIAGFRRTLAYRLKRVSVSAAQDRASGRYLVRRYHLSYLGADQSFHSLLAAMQGEGRPEADHPSPAIEAMIGDRFVHEDGGDDWLVHAGTDICAAAFDSRCLPPLRFAYAQPPDNPGTKVPGFGSFSTRLFDAVSSPPHSLDEDLTELFDINADGLADVVVTDPARYKTASGAPAVGVFFNGFQGAAALPTQGATFSAAVPVAMPPELAGVMRLNNPNIAPLDIDGDGRGDFLHMPRVATYGWFQPTRTAASASEISPAKQGWELSYSTVKLPKGVTDPRIDLGEDGPNIQTADVNNDGLIDVVRSTGLSLQTWLNLGSYPGGEGRFGQAHFQSSGLELSPVPLESCLPSDGLPVDFDAREIRLADMNGDGLLDILHFRRGYAAWWPARGDGVWGEGSRTCPGGQIVKGRELRMSSPPAELNANLGNVLVQDVNADGAADMLQIRADAVDLWLNRAGQSFAPRVILHGLPFTADFSPRVRVTDLDGSGTPDLVWGTASHWQYVDLLAGVRPRVLVRMENGVGMVNELTYGSSTEDYLRDLKAAASCTGSDCERFTWQRTQPLPRGSATDRHTSGGSPVITTVVRSLTVRDRMNELGLPQNIARSDYAYHDGYYEGIEQEFRGFGAADSTSAGDSSQPGATQRTWFHQGRRPSSVAFDRLANNPYESLKSLPYLAELFSLSGTYLNTGHSSYSVRRLMTGLDGRFVTYAYPTQADELRYDTAPFKRGSDVLTFPGVSWESVKGGSANDGWPVASDVHQVRVRGATYALLRTSTDVVDNMGHVLQSTAHGRVVGEYGEKPNERSVTHARAVLLSGANWLWRNAGGYLSDDSANGTRYGETENAYDARGDLIDARQHAYMPGSYSFGSDASFVGSGDAAEQFTTANSILESSRRVDTWGNLIVTCVGADLRTQPESDCLRLGHITYDPLFAQMPGSEGVANDTTSTGALTFLTTTASYDRGLGLVLSATGPNGTSTEVGYTGQGKLSFIRPAGTSDCATDARPPSHSFSYAPAVAGSPVSLIKGRQYIACGNGRDAYVEARTYVDGIGRVRALLTQGNAAGEWIKGNIKSYGARGAPVRTYQTGMLKAVDPTPGDAVALPLTAASGGAVVPSSSVSYDAFSRVVASYAEDGARTQTLFHALSVDECDTLDLEGGATFRGTCSTLRADGHGRALDKVLRQRLDALGPTVFYRLFYTYRTDGAVASLTRAQTTDDGPLALTTVMPGRSVSRAFAYDSLGRRVAASDPDSNAPGPINCPSCSFRYLYNRAGDLSAVRDPRGCGQNFYYDRMGRLLGEDYVSCAEAQAPAERPSDTIPTGAVSLERIGAPRRVDVRYYYDTTPPWASELTLAAASPRPVSLDAGRLVAGVDRGERWLVAYDARGRESWSGKQMAVLAPAASNVPQTLSDPPAPFASENIAPQTFLFDTAHTYVRAGQFDYAGRPIQLELPRDPDFVGGASPVVQAKGTYNTLGLEQSASAVIDGHEYPIIRDLRYTRDGLVERMELGDTRNGTRTPTVTTLHYDTRRRLHSSETVRSPTGTDGLSAVSVPSAQEFHWDAVSNLEGLLDLRVAAEWPVGARPQDVTLERDALYRVVRADFAYGQPGAHSAHSEPYQDWRLERQKDNADGKSHWSADPMRETAAPMLPSAPTERPANITWEYDWLANMVEWTDDQQSFYERSLGTITNGQESGGRPAALYLASNLPGPAAPAANMLIDRGGYAEVDYGVGGNVVALTVHARCHDAAPSKVCYDPSGTPVESRRSAMHGACSCKAEQHYQYRWDEINRIAEARRYDRAGTGTWRLAVRQRYRYDANNVRTVKQTLDTSDPEEPPERVALFVFPGDYERRGLHTSADGTRYEADAVLGTETSYMVAGARIVWKTRGPTAGAYQLNPDLRMTYALDDYLATASGVVDIMSGELSEYSTYYPNGARETLLTQHDVSMPDEPYGFTGKEEDEEVGLVYFGERYLIPRLGRWASPDPQQIHGSGGGEALNSYHYVAGNLFQARDPLGLDAEKTGPVRIANADGSVTYWTADNGEFTFEAHQTRDIAQWDRFVEEYWEEETRAKNVVLGVIPFGNTIHDIEKRGFKEVSKDLMAGVAKKLGLSLLPGGLAISQVKDAYDELRVLQKEYDNLSSKDPVERGIAKGAIEARFILIALNIIAGYASKGPGWELAAAKAGAAGRYLLRLEKFCENSFAEGTLVLTESGLVPIETIAIGDLVWARSEDGEEEGFKPVTDIIVGHSKAVMALTLRNERGEVVEILATPEHPFFVEGEDWVDAQDLQFGDLISDAERGTLEVIGLETTEEKSEVRNLSVEGYQTYFVTELGAWVHNCTRAHAIQLRRNLEKARKAGINVGKGTDAAHIVASGGEHGHWAPAAKSRDLLEHNGLHVDEAYNGVYLDSAEHGITHRGAFHAKVYNQLQTAADAASKAGRNVGEALKAELGTIRQGILDGSYLKDIPTAR